MSGDNLGRMSVTPAMCLCTSHGTHDCISATPSPSPPPRTPPGKSDIPSPEFPLPPRKPPPESAAELASSAPYHLAPATQARAVGCSAWRTARLSLALALLSARRARRLGLSPCLCRSSSRSRTPHECCSRSRSRSRSAPGAGDDDGEKSDSPFLASTRPAEVKTLSSCPRSKKGEKVLDYVFCSYSLSDSII